MSKLAEFLQTKKINEARLLVASHRVESCRPVDRQMSRAKKLSKEAGASDAVKELAAQKRRSGRPVTAPALRAALAGKSIAGPMKSKMVRAVNRVLQQRQQPEAQLRDLF